MGTASHRERLETCELSGSDLLPTNPAPRIARGTRSPFETPSITPDFFGNYLVYEELGSGGMATVHRAESPGILGFRKPVALKRMLPHVARDPKSMRAFLEEARLASRLHHENIAQAYDFGEINGTYFIAMELVPGPTLRQIMMQCASAAGAIPVPIAIEILIQLCEALDYAHNLKDPHGRKLNIIHRDVSPTNVIVSGSGVVKLIDFGIAKVEHSTDHTATGIIKGKLGYLAPEYLAGRLDYRADLFGLGVVAHELLTGKRLFPGTSDFEVCNAVREKPIPRPSRYNPQVSATLDDIVLTALQRDPDQRWQSAHAMQTALRNAARELGAGVSHRQIRDWTEWAFTQNSRSSIEIIKIVDSIAEAPTPLAIVRENPTIVARPPRSAKYPVERPTRRPIAAWLLAVFVLGLAGVGVWQSIDSSGIEAIVRDLAD
jgi:eukaryotic-like serine/threonine-protein kinase